MKVFVSWSGRKSRDVARALGDWLPSVLHAVDPFVSSKDIRAGTRWQAEIAKELDDTHFGLICVTKENQDAEWLNFEAGALAKSVTSSRVVPLAVDLSPADIANPLGQFQAMRLTKEEISEVLASMNEACSSPIAEETLRKTVEKWWPDLEEELSKIKNHDYGSKGSAPAPSRTDRELLEEVVDAVRGFGRAPMMNPPPAIERPAERAREELKEVLLASEHGIRSWNTRTDGNVIWVETVPDPSPELAEKARAIESHYGVELHLGSRGSFRSKTAN
ncbi:MAG TPA: toll/interleukin-1 receptor domain-containing protein [Solirubrobacterales bacterium]|nr:toll/interleukin-1 receptor domain-containing protein [Solirubrobacterales bacterium]